MSATWKESDVDAGQAMKTLHRSGMTSVMANFNQV